MKFKGTTRLETERLILRKIVLEDAYVAYKNWCNSDVVDKYVIWKKHLSVDTTINQFKKWIDEYSDDKTFRWIVELKSNHDLVGTIDVSKKFLNFGSCAIGYCYSDKYWNNGYATEALKAVIKYLFEECDADIVNAEFMEDNVGSGKVMEKCGMIQEGCLRNRCEDKSGKKQNLISMSITKDEYFKN